ncbi:hypothetical protein DB30_03259 [Enhygromyxa salina]|uniref:Uncharacterized protein n=1 Tax=Enhygromyxa salina TaxID=215803 RepID=A0A0C2A2D3_9BACT|nr:hypothetical protein DB30_03259 [Enhygromyxa salina]
MVRHGDFMSAAHQRRRVLGFIGCWNRDEKHPFRWTWRSDWRQHELRATA